MRSSKSRSRNKSNRQRSLGNIVNRVFDSSGPEGKVRGTPQQIIDKYLMLARDAQLSNDRVAEQAFLQHAEHYTRMLGEAQRELAREQEQRQHQNGNAPQFGQSAGNGQPERAEHVREQAPSRPVHDSAGEQPDFAPLETLGDEDGSDLVETPEMLMERRADAFEGRAPGFLGGGDADPEPARPARARAEGARAEPAGERPARGGDKGADRSGADRRPRNPRRRPDAPADAAAKAAADAPAAAGDADAPRAAGARAPKASRAPRRPRGADGGVDGGADAPTAPAAEGAESDAS